MNETPPLLEAAVDGSRVSWREAGSGPALVLVHGIGGHSGAFRRQFSFFSPSRRVIGWDQPGYGRSALLGRQASAEAYAGALASFLVQRDVRSADFIGHSLGSIVVAALARLTPAIVRSAVFLQPVAGGGGLSAAERAAMRESRSADVMRLSPRDFAEKRAGEILGGACPPEVRREATDVMADVPRDAYLRALDVMCEADLAADLAAFAAPSLVISGSDDPVSPVPLGRRLAAVAGGAFEELAYVGHYAAIEAPHRLNRVVETFLTSHPARGTAA